MYLSIVTDVMSKSGRQPGRPKQDQVIEQIRRLGVARTRELERGGTSREYLRLLVQRGVVERIARGLYALPDADVS